MITEVSGTVIQAVESNIGHADLVHHWGTALETILRGAGVELWLTRLDPRSIKAAQQNIEIPAAGRRRLPVLYTTQRYPVLNPEEYKLRMNSIRDNLIIATDRFPQPVRGIAVYGSYLEAKELFKQELPQHNEVIDANVAEAYQMIRSVLKPRRKPLSYMEKALPTI